MNKRAFTLVELAIVLVIIGLLVGGVLAGQELIKQSRLNSVIKQMRDYEIAFATFRTKYGSNCLPGDCTKAVSFFGSGTINGNGNRIIDWPVNDTTDKEMLTAWQQLGMAGLIDANLDGAYSSGNYGRIGGNIPAIKAYEGAGIWMLAAGGSFYTNIFGKNNKNALILGGLSHTGTRIYNGFLPPADAMQIDRKVDDGVAVRGKLIGGNGIDAGAEVPGCTLASTGATYGMFTATATPPATDYNPAGTGNCVLINWID